MKYNIVGAVDEYGKNSGLPTVGLVKAFEDIEAGYINNGLNRIKSKVLRIITAECTQSVDGYIYGSNNDKIMINSCLPPKWMIGIKDVADFRDFMDDNGLLVTDLFPIAVVSEFYRQGKVNIGNFLDEYSVYQSDRIADIILKNNIKRVLVSSRYKAHIDKTKDFEDCLKKVIDSKGGNPEMVESHESISGNGGFLDKGKFEVFRTFTPPDYNHS